MNCSLEHIQYLFARARQDTEYAALTEMYKTAQAAFENLAENMTDAEQDILWGFVCISEQMNWRMLELICRWYSPDSTEE